MDATHSEKPGRDWEDDRRMLEQELGTSDAQMIVDMVRSLEAQLVDLYRDLDPTAAAEGEQ